MEEAFLRTARSIYQNIQNGSLDLNAAGSLTLLFGQLCAAALHTPAQILE